MINEVNDVDIQMRYYKLGRNGLEFGTFHSEYIQKDKLAITSLTYKDVSNVNSGGLHAILGVEDKLRVLPVQL